MRHFIKKLTLRFFMLMISVSLAGTSACNIGNPVPTPMPSETPTPPATSTPIPTVTPTSAPIQPMDAERTLLVNGLQRSYLIYIPPGLSDQQAVPLVFIFHGFGESGLLARLYTGLDAIASANRFVLVYPNGSGPNGAFSWNGSGCCGYADENQVDDIAFVRAIIADVRTLVGIDDKRIYAAGFSNGALLAYRLACEISDTFAAIAPVGGILLYSPCEPQQPVSVLHIHGLQDTRVPFINSGQPFPSGEQSVATWATLNGCTDAQIVEQTEFLTHTSYGPCAPGIAVELYTLDIGHAWPSSLTIAPLSQTVWDFFAAHPKP